MSIVLDEIDLLDDERPAKRRPRPGEVPAAERERPLAEPCVSRCAECGGSWAGTTAETSAAFRAHICDAVEVTTDALAASYAAGTTLDELAEATGIPRASLHRRCVWLASRCDGAARP